MGGGRLVSEPKPKVNTRELLALVVKHRALLAYLADK